MISKLRFKARDIIVALLSPTIGNCIDGISDLSIRYRRLRIIYFLHAVIPSKSRMSEDLHNRNRYDKFGSPRPNVIKLLHNLVPDVPGQNQYVVRFVALYRHPPSIPGCGFPVGACPVCRVKRQQQTQAGLLLYRNSLKGIPFGCGTVADGLSAFSFLFNQELKQRILCLVYSCLEIA